MENIEKAWLAVALDTRGYVAIVKDGTAYRPCVQILNTNEWFIDRAVRILGADNVDTLTIQDERGLKLPQYRVNLKRRIMVEVLEQVMPYMIVKRERAELVVEFLKSKSDRTPYGKGEEEGMVFYRAYRGLMQRREMRGVSPKGDG